MSTIGKEQAPPSDESIVAHEDEPQKLQVIRAYACGPVGARPIPLERAIPWFNSPETKIDNCQLVWIDIVNPGSEAATFLREKLRFHPLAIEDCLRGRQRPKIERYPGYFFLVAYAARINTERDRVAFNELHAFIGDRFIVTVHDHRIDEVRETLARWRSSPAQFTNVGTVAHALLDAIVDDYFPIVDHFADHVSKAESVMLDRPEDEATVQQILAIRRELILFRRVGAPLRDMIARLIRRELPFVGPELLPYFQDLRDHAVRITEEIDTLHELVATILESHNSAAAHQLNRTMRVMTAWSIILMTMAVIAGVYGMNFRHMPELSWQFGYGFALVLMLSIGTALYTFFRWRKWI